ncbi:YbbR-like domain-containing protein [Daejeonella sp. H1SJ63]|jgi:YbbR domain-containing protein|uniref:YbbR-like domain-containing protein n=1 Tax=Daejeonella sp. H1SJ63 TaxID=3034145 RepID=UPI0023EB2F38|nr:YbbR-like domain-containing protein [Daejeonella sp. H1SJ63]
MPFIKFNKTERRRLSLFFVCIIVAVGAWMFLSLSNRYIYQVQTLVRFVNFPQNKAFKPLQSDTIDLKVEGTGWQLLFSKMRIKPQSVDVDLGVLNRKTFVDLSLQLPQINRQFESSQKIVQIEPDTLYFDFSARSVKRIPIRLVHKIVFMPHYGISDSVNFFPDYVTVTGPIKELEQIKSWPTDTLILKNINSNLSTKISLKRPVQANISIYPGIVDARLKVDEFTEKVIEVPVRLLNNNEYGNVKILPDKVKVTFLTALSNYRKIDRSYFELSIDLNNWKNKGYKQLPVHIDRFPDYCKLIKIEPQNIDFIIQR